MLSLELLWGLKLGIWMLNSHINHRTVAIIVRLFIGRRWPALNRDAGIGVAGQNVQGDGNEADDERAQDRIAEGKMDAIARDFKKWEQEL